MAWEWIEPCGHKRRFGGFRTEAAAKQNAIFNASGHRHALNCEEDAPQLEAVWRSLARVGWIVRVELGT